MSPRGRPGKPYLAGKPLLMAHRGGAGLAPENTMAAFRQAVDVWQADVLELDVRLTADGRLVVIHDATVDRTTDGSGAVGQMSWVELQELDAAHRFRDPGGGASFAGKGVSVPLLEEVLETFPTMRLNIEAKEAQAAGPLVETIRRFGAEQRVLVAAEHEQNRTAARGYQGPWGASRSHVRLFWLTHRIPFLCEWLLPPMDALQVPERAGRIHVTSPSMIAAADRLNIPIHVWTVDDVDDMVRLLEAGVDGIQTDRPDRLAQVLVDRYGRPAPPGLTAQGS